MSVRSAVIGAGPAGCTAASLLKASGRHVVLFEKEPYPGGRTRTWRENGLRLDTGAGFFTNFYQTLSYWLGVLGLKDQVVELPHTSALVHMGTRADLSMRSPGSFAAFPFLGWKDKARMALHASLAAARYRKLNLADPASLALLDDRSVAEDAVARLGQGLYDFAVRPGIEPFWYFSCGEVSRSLFLALLARAATARFYTLVQGMDQICHALTKDIECRNGTAIVSIEQDDCGFLLHGADLKERFNEVVVATTASTAFKLTHALGEPFVNPSQREFIRTQDYVPNIHAAYLADRAGCPDGPIGVFPYGPGQNPIAAISFNSMKRQCLEALPKEKELVSVYLAGWESRIWLDSDRNTLFEHCWRLARDLCPSLPEEAKPLVLIPRREAIPVHSVGRYRLAAGFQREQTGPLVFAGDYLATATVDGAMRTGVLAAERLIRDKPPE